MEPILPLLSQVVVKIKHYLYEINFAVLKYHFNLIFKFYCSSLSYFFMSKYSNGWFSSNFLLSCIATSLAHDSHCKILNIVVTFHFKEVLLQVLETSMLEKVGLIIHYNEISQSFIKMNTANSR